jgi:hypothetical protein
MPTTHRLSFPTCLFHPGNMHLHCSTVHRLLHFPFQIRNSQSSVAGAGLSLGENHFPTNSPRAYLCPLLIDSHSPHACSTLGICTFTVPQSIDCSKGLRNSDQNSQSSVAGAGLSLGENHFPTNSLTWRELLTGLTTCLFNHGPDNPLLQPTSTQFQQVRTIERLNIAQGMETTTIR